jgi:2-polyprenyl-6-methoxyphenol hydroxylase-like FAD-dependent oxidoreductase
MGIHVRYNARVVSVAQDVEGVVALFSDGTEARGDVLIGADGIHSAVRHSIFPKLDIEEKKKRGYFGCGAIIPIGYLSSEEASFLGLSEGNFNTFNGSLGFVGFVGTGEGKFMFWSHIAQANVPPGFDHTDLTQVKDILLSLRGSWCPPIRKVIELIDQRLEGIEVLCGPIVSLNPIPAWSEKRVVLVGDAAHGFGPGAQGAAMAMEDAIMLVRMMAECQENRPEVWSDIFRRFEAKRRPRVEAIGAASEARNDERLVDNGYLWTKIKQYSMRVACWWYSYRERYYDASVAYRVEDDS